MANNHWLYVSITAMSIAKNCFSSFKIAENTPAYANTCFRVRRNNYRAANKAKGESTLLVNP
jgi:hypothetical protein